MQYFGTNLDLQVFVLNNAIVYYNLVNALIPIQREYHA